MNIALLIIGVMIVVCSVVLITINSSKETQDKLKLKERKASVKSYDKSYVTHSQTRNIYTEKYNDDEGVFYKKIKDEILENPIRKNQTIDIVKETVQKDIKTKEKIKLDESLYKSHTEEESEVLSFSKLGESDVSIEEENLTDKIIKMKKEGLGVNEIAKKLNKGVREVEIILKINKINY